VSASGLSAARLSRIHDVLGGYVERGEVPGLVSVVARRGEAHLDAIGAQRDSLFRIASMTKPVTAAAAMILVEDGRARLDEPVDEVLPELANRQVLRSLGSELDDTVPSNRPISLRDLLTFRLGWGAVMAMPGTYPIQRAMEELGLAPGPPAPAKMPPPDEYMRRLGTLPLMHQPGERWMYNTGSDVLGIYISRVSGRTLDVFLRERIFEPLGMKDTGFHVRTGDVKRLLPSYSTNWQTGKVEVYDPPDGQWSRPPTFASGAGGLVSTADDFLAFGEMMLNQGVRGKTRILSRPAVATMTTDQISPGQKAVSGLGRDFFENQGWGFGLSIITRRFDTWASIGKFGWNGGLGTSWYSDPEEDMVTILLTQRGMESPEAPPAFLDFWTLAYAAIED
jgi:CubicO group peptidase (beta-lactamase class C family)